MQKQQHKKPFVDDKPILCGTCRKYEKCVSGNKNKVTLCPWHDTLEAKLKRDRDATDLLAVVKSGSGARVYKKKIEDIMLEPDLYSSEGNSTTHINLGARKTLKDEMNILKRLLNINTNWELIIYLDGKAKGA